MANRHPASRHFLALGLFDGLNSFAEIEARVSALPSNKERGDAFEVFAEAYLATQKINEAREVWPFESIPLEQRKLLSLNTGRDMGVDGTYQTHDGELRAYQVKFRSTRSALTWDELSTFMGLTDQVSQRVLFTNCEALPSLMRDRSGFIAIRGSDLDRLTPEDFEAMRLWLQSGHIKLPRKQPKPHQQEALAAITNELNANDRATVVMACGTGKSLVALWAAEQRGCRNILVLLPSLALVRQLLHEWLRETSWEKLAYLCVCSDPTVAKGADDLIVHQADLDFPVMTDSEVVGKFLSKPFDGVKVVFSTYQSAHIVAEGMSIGANGERQPFDLGIFDEAHKTASRSGTRFSFALADENLPVRKRLFFTATPRHYDIRKKDKEGDNELVYSMDRQKVYGKVAHTLSFAEAARLDIICNYKVVISVVTSEMVNDYVLKHGEVIVAGDPVKARQVALQIALQAAVEKYGVSRIFTFHGSVAAARSFTSDDGEGIRHHLNGFQTWHVSGAMRTSEREDHMKAFRQAEKAVMSNARCLTEGVDVPAVDMVAFMSPRKSKVDIVQVTGRAMRRSDETGKEFGYVMVPLFLDLTANETIEEALHRTGYSDVWDVLTAMMEQDDVLTDIIRQMREDQGRTGGYDDSRFRERIEVLGPSVSLEVIRNSITAECVERLGATWDERYGELLAFKQTYGNCDVPGKWSQNRYLAAWVATQRKLYDKGKLSPERTKRLELLGFDLEPFDSKWDERFAALSAYKLKHGNCNVPSESKEMPELATWCSTQRYNYVNNQLLPNRIERLEQIGFVWRPIDAAWEEMFTALAVYKQTYGNCNVPKKWKPNPKLATWCVHQRTDYQRNKLSAVRIQRLEELGFEWVPQDVAWEGMFDALTGYKAAHGNCNVSREWPDNPKLGKWCAHQRTAHQNGKLPDDRTQHLEGLGFAWNSLDAVWEDMFTALSTYRQTCGDCNVTRGWKDNPQLANWCQRQRNVYKNKKLLPDRLKRLEDIGFAWDPLVANWEVMFAALVNYKQTHGDFKVPPKWDEIPTLGDWCQQQRSAYKYNKLSPERIKRLEDIGFEWNPLDARWEKMFAALTTYKQVQGDCNVPTEWDQNPKLGQWCYVLRRSYRKGTLSADHIKRLEEIGFEWEHVKELKRRSFT